ncbi:MAG: GerMN domain-containing protein [Acidimicrobiia bacterium]|nr:GerMN domain-containing protein [Acidimicrobiia bacterium]
MRGKWSVAVLGLVGALAVTSCGVETQESSVEVNKDAVPFGLLDESTTTTTTVPDGAARVVVYWDSPKGLVGFARSVAGGPTATHAFAELRSGPTTAEVAAGMSTALADRVFSLISVRNGQAVVRLGANLGPNERIPVEAIGQMVLTLTETPGVRNVVFRVGTDRVEVPRGNGSLTAAPVTRSDYTALVRPT